MIDFETVIKSFTGFAVRPLIMDNNSQNNVMILKCNNNQPT